jgi:GWxTD domain-containing protein
MKRLLSLISIFMLFILLVPAFAQDKKDQELPLTDAHQKFLDIVYWIISDYEKTAFLSLKTNEDRDRFIDAFWENRDPTPGTKQNEFREEHRARWEYATKQFGRDTSIPGWKTDRGKVYILLGKPQFIKRNPSPFELYPNELWQYSGYKGYGLPGSIYFLFFQEQGTGTYRLYSPLQDGIKELFVQQSGVMGKTDAELFDKLQQEIDPDLAHAAFSSIPTEGGDPSQFINSGSISAEMIQAKLQNARNFDLPKRKYVEAFVKDLPNVTVYTSLDSAGIHDGLFWFKAENGDFYIDYGVEFQPDKLDMGQYNEEYYTSLSIDGSISTPDQKLKLDEIIGSHEIKLNPQQFAKIQSLPFQYQGRRPIVPGKYGVTLIMNNNVSRRSITFSHEVNIPDMTTEKAPVFSPLVPIRSAEKAKPEDKKLRPFQFGEAIYTPNLQSHFSSKGNISVYHQVIFPDHYVGGIGALNLRYVVMQGDNVEKEFTESLNLKPEDLAGNAIDVVKDIPPGQLSYGSKRLFVELRQDEKVISRSESMTFEVQPEEVPGAWKYAVSIPNFDSPYHSYALAQQYLKLNRPKEAVELLEHAFQQNPDSPELRTQLMRVALKNRNYERVIELGTPAEVKNPRNKEILWLLGWANYGMQKYEDAVRFFERLRIEEPNKVEVFNLLADIYYRLDQKDKSLERIQQSLALKPDQKDIVELKKKVESN